MSRDLLSEVKDRNVLFTFVAPNVPLPYGQQRHALLNALRRRKMLEEGELLDSLEERAMFPIIHQSKIIPVQLDEAELLGSSDLGEEFFLQQGIYLERKHRQTSRKHTIQCPNDERAFIFMGFKSLDTEVSEVLLRSWTEWTGARLVHIFLTDDVHINRYSFFHRVAPADPELFMYILLVECHNVTRLNRMHLLDFIQRLRVERVFGYLTVYRSEPLTSTASLINGIMSEKEDYVGKVDI